MPTDPTSAPANCPRCRGAMRPVKAGEFTVDRCDACRGLWFDTLELDRVSKDRSLSAVVDPEPHAPAPGGRPKGPMLCPRDRSTLIRMAALGQPHIKYESCKVCGGAFLDAGELRDLSEVSIRERLAQFFG